MGRDRSVEGLSGFVRISATRMATDYVRVYNSLLALTNVNLVPNQAEPLQTTAGEFANEPPTTPCRRKSV
jgi:hypothetical protein